jgi:hypothetical protein
MPDIPQQAEAVRNPAQRDGDKPSRNHHQRHRRNIDAKHVDFGKPHASSPASK